MREGNEARQDVRTQSRCQCPNGVQVDQPCTANICQHLPTVQFAYICMFRKRTGTAGAGGKGREFETLVDMLVHKDSPE